MIQVNLLPNIKQEFVKSRRNKRLVVLGSSFLAAASLIVLILLFVVVQFVQHRYANDLSKDIASENSKLQAIPDLNKILTIQNQLDSLTSLHDQKPVVTRLPGYIKAITPAKVSIATLAVDLQANTINITGSADSVSTINKFVDTLKFTTYKSSDGSDTNAFSSVVLTSFGNNEKGSSYEITFLFDPIIFSSEATVKLNVPANKITTRSETEKPEALFQPLPSKSSGGQ